MDIFLLFNLYFLKINTIIEKKHIYLILKYSSFFQRNNS